VIDAGPLRRSSRIKKLPDKFKDFHLANLCHAEAYSTLDSTTDALSWEPAPRSIREIVEMTHGPVKEAWLKSVKAELKTLINAKTFIHDEMQEGETNSNFDIELDQTRYCLAILKKFLDSVGCPKNNSLVSTPLPFPFLPSSDDCSVDENAVAKLEEEYNIEYASCIGSLIYLTMTRTGILFAVNKLAKFSRSPGRVHFDVLIHLLRYLRDNVYLGIKFYSNFMEAPLLKSLSSQNIEQHHPFFCFSDSSWNDDPDTGRSTGCFIITYMGRVVDHSSNMPNPVALSSTESEYNEGCVAFMTASHLRMLLCVLEQISEEDMSPITIYFDSKSAIAMGSSYKDTKHTRHIERR
jgi:hypothetical protein